MIRVIILMYLTTFIMPSFFLVANSLMVVTNSPEDNTLLEVTNKYRLFRYFNIPFFMEDIFFEFEVIFQGSVLIRKMCLIY